MIPPERPEPMDDADLDTVSGAGLLDSEPGTFGAKPAGFEPVTLERGAVGETEKSVWKAPAGVTHSTEFER